jgi:uncharacterized membrane protein YeaQ/YmgE (transglycosylase-associated protein family)
VDADEIVPLGRRIGGVLAALGGLGAIAAALALWITKARLAAQAAVVAFIVGLVGAGILLFTSDTVPPDERDRYQ